MIWYGLLRHDHREGTKRPYHGPRWEAPGQVLESVRHLETLARGRWVGQGPGYLAGAGGVGRPTGASAEGGSAAVGEPGEVDQGSGVPVAIHEPGPALLRR